jgi:hypothetical protein
MRKINCFIRDGGPNHPDSYRDTNDFLKMLLKGLDTKGGDIRAITSRRKARTANQVGDLIACSYEVAPFTPCTQKGWQNVNVDDWRTIIFFWLDKPFH